MPPRSAESSDSTLESLTVTDSGAVTAQGDITLRGKHVAGRDLTINQYLRESGPLVTALFQLPPDVLDFTGRDDTVERVIALIEQAPTQLATAVVVSAIAGKAGVGKTALAVHIAHRLVNRFPDGQLYVDLRGFSPDRLHPSAVLAEFLRALGLEGRSIPESIAERTSLYRAGLARRRVLVLLDNASDEGQVRPLLPGSPTCTALITSRRQLPGLEAARTFALDVLPTDQAVALLGRICGEDRVAREPQAARQVVEVCGALPLAVRIAGARLALRPHWRISQLARRLVFEHRRLSELKAGDLEVRSSFALSYENEEPEVRRLFRLLGLLKTPDFAAWVAAPLLDVDPEEAEEVLERLVDAQLLEVAGEDLTGAVRYRFHDLLRVYARERLMLDEPEADRDAAQRRMLGAYLRLAERAHEAQWPDGLRPRPGAERWP